MTDADLQRIFVDGAEGPCDHEGDVVRAAAGDLSADELRPVLAHVRGCGGCAALWARVRAELASSDDGAAAVSPRAPTMATDAVVPANTPWRWGVLGALGVAAALALAVLVWPDQPSTAPDWRAGEGRGVVLMVADDATAADGVLRWEPVPHAYRYTVRLSADDLSPVHQAHTTSPQLVVPPELAGRRLLWQVTASMGDGTVRRSPSQWVRVPERAPENP